MTRPRATTIPLFLTLSLALASSSGGCADGPSGGDASNVSYRRDVQPVWDRWCTRCHNFIEPHLVAKESARELDGRRSWEPCRGGSEHAPFVVPGDPDASFLLFKLTGVNTGGYVGQRGCGRVMPADENGMDVPLLSIDPAGVDTVRAWIDQGAVFD